MLEGYIRPSTGEPGELCVPVRQCSECRDTDPVIVSACGDTAVGLVASWDRPEDSAQYWTTPVEGYDTGETQTGMGRQLVDLQ
ncbi:hypothetical protein J6590_091534 [Homalodisca vitripennis]|nr:hypothetical protein J6590_091534 [Homalodisca vitripennis]